jgi:hypothetical protein
VGRAFRHDIKSAFSSGVLTPDGLKMFFRDARGRYNSVLLQCFYLGEYPGVNRRHPNYRRCSRIVNLNIPHLAPECRRHILPPFVSFFAVQCEISSSARPPVRGPKMPIDSTTISMLVAMNAKTPFVPKFSRKKAIIKLVNIVERRLQE